MKMIILIRDDNVPSSTMEIDALILNAMLVWHFISYLKMCEKKLKLNFFISVYSNRSRAMIAVLYAVIICYVAYLNFLVFICSEK